MCLLARLWRPRIMMSLSGELTPFPGTRCRVLEGPIMRIITHNAPGRPRPRVATVAPLRTTAQRVRTAATYQHVYTLHP
ncbi:hypothetical protein SKAU_G00033390 [Synaphobranchus kaupii]|uniref:Uncharacterized protein n=1 Tax=Synaphobranchus kaupii TaxID=118154 RepID=A0A9Q1GE37_SYNKA|nr:hypothetical protein SKAU_G00033390 [Synaphobranchus kaupii]